MLLGGVGEAFDLSKEDAKTVERYDTAKLGIDVTKIDKKWNNYKHYADNAQHARQAAAAGAPAVRTRCRLRHGHDELRLGHARGREQRAR